MNRVDRRVVASGGMNGTRIVPSLQRGDVWPAFFATGRLAGLMGQQAQQS